MSDRKQYESVDNTVYVLALEQNKYYVGKTRTDRLQTRLDEHSRKDGSAWTSKYTVLHLVETYPDADQFLEDIVVKRYMLKFGIGNVRGGSYVLVKLPRYQQMALEKELNSAVDGCWRCGRKGHFTNKCYAKTHIDGSAITDNKYANTKSTASDTQKSPKFKNKGFLDMVSDRLNKWLA